MRRTMCALLGAACAAAALSSSAAASVQVSQSGWSWGNPTPQGNTLRAAAFLAGRGYAVGDAGTALRTDDGGATWTGLATGTAANLDRLQIVTPDVLVVQSGDGCVLRRSDDGGRTFRRIYVLTEHNCPNPVQAAYFVDAQIGYVLLRDGSLLRTIDAGQTFAKQTAVPGTPASTGGGSDKVDDFVFTSADRGLVFVTSQGNSVLYETTDQGVSWKPVPLTPGVLHVRRVTFLDAKNAYAVGQNTLLASTDGGGTWQRRRNFEPGDLTSITCSDPSTCLLTVTAGDRLLRTTDGGATETAITASTQAIFAAAFDSPTRVVAAGAGGATVISNDGGVNYSPVGGDIGGSYGSMRGGPSPQVAYAIGAAGQIAATADGGSTWRVMAVPTSAPIRDASFATQQTGYALDSGGGLFKTSNGGQSWQTLDPGTSSAAQAVMALGAGTVLLAAPRGVLRQVGGGRFDAVSDADVARLGVGHFDLADGAVVAYGSRGVALTANGGTAWRTVALPNPTRRKRNPLRVASADFVSSRIGYLVDTTGRVWSTTSGGKRWIELAAKGASEVTSVHFASPSSGWLTALRYPADLGSAYVLHTTDGGRSWRPQRLSVGSTLGLVAGTATQAYALSSLSGPGRQLFATSTGGDAGTPSLLKLSTRTPRLTRKTLQRAHGQVTIRGALAGAQGGEQIVVSRRDAKGGRWVSQVVTAGANGGSFTAAFRVTRSSFFVAQWAGDSGRTGAGTPVLGVSVK